MPTLPFKPPAPLAGPITQRCLGFLCVAFLLALSGCSTPEDVVRPIHVAGGHVIGVPFGPNGPRPGRDNGYEVIYASIGPGPTDQELNYRLAVKVPPGAKPQSIKVEDISDDQPYLLFDDLHPWLEDQTWHVDTLPMKHDDPRLAWVMNVMASIRVYRFTILDDAGKKSLLYQVTVYPDYLKSAIRRKWGEKY